ncbi:hypothetical protein OC834_000176 [Tilletia horrida]|nr:hypothetical protein OC834_000176 [Tilletia horrida]
MAPSKLSSHRVTAPIDPAKIPVICSSVSTEPAGVDVDLPQTPIPASSYFDLVVIGSGPAAVALLTRLMEKRPAALYLEDEHRYLHWLHSKDATGISARALRRSKQAAEHAPSSAPLLKTKFRPASTDRVFVGKSSPPHSPTSQTPSGVRAPRPLRILVIDRIGGWLELWNRLFAAYEIPHLRSPMFFHPSPADLDALLAYAQRTARNTMGTWQPEPLAQAGTQLTQERAGDAVTRPKKVDRSMRRKMKHSSSRFGTLALPEGSDLPNAKHTGPELIEIRGCVGKEITKHRRKKARAQQHHHHGGNQLGSAVNERDRRDYFTPGTDLFRDFVRQDLIKHYGLPGADPAQPWPELPALLNQLDEADDDTHLTQTIPTMASKGGSSMFVARGEVTAMTWHQQLHVAGQGHIPAMLLCTADGTAIAAGTVVSAIGPGGVPNVPDVLKAADTKRKEAEAEAAEGESASAPSTSEPLGKGWCHSAALALPHFTFPPTEVQHKIVAHSSASRSERGPTCVVIGGGLTSAQLCILALRKGFGKVVLLLRGHMKVKPFDVSLDWLSKWANTMKMQFWQEDDPAERLLMLRSARNGGSITPAYARYLRELERAGLLEIRTHVEMERVDWVFEQERWDVRLRCTCDAPSGSATPPSSVAPEETARGKDETRRPHFESCEPCVEPACVAGESLHEPGCVSASDSDNEEEGEGRSSKSSANSDGAAKRQPQPQPQPQRPPSGLDEDEDDERLKKDQEKRIEADYIITSTGPILSLPTLPAFSTLARTHPIPTFGGLPLVSEDLQWQSFSRPEGTNSGSGSGSGSQAQPRLFMVGAYAALQIGPAAFNLGGMREAAERVAGRLIRDWEAEAEAEEEEEEEVVQDRDEHESVEGEEEEEDGEEVEERYEPWQTGRWSTLAERYDDSLLLAA